MSHVFVSYARRDRAFVDRLVAARLSAGGPYVLLPRHRRKLMYQILVFAVLVATSMIDIGDGVTVDADRFVVESVPDSEPISQNPAAQADAPLPSTAKDPIAEDPEL